MLMPGVYAENAGNSCDHQMGGIEIAAHQAIYVGWSKLTVELPNSVSLQMILISPEMNHSLLKAASAADVDSSI